MALTSAGHELTLPPAATLDATVFQLLKHLCSLFVFLSLYVERVCVYTHVLVLPPFLCVGVFPEHSRHTHEGDRT